jgi:LL-diaminopimelate aminotransferase
MVHAMPLLEENGYLPDLDAIPEDVCRRAAIMFLNYPNNPTAAIAPPEFLDKAIEFCIKHEILMIYDNAYSEIYSGNRRNAPISPLSRPGGMDICLEMGSLSKPFSMTGWRVGYAVGNAEAVRGLLQVKKNVDSGVFEAIQLSAIRALQDCQDEMRHNNDIYTGRKEEFARIISEAGWNIPVTDSTFYLWTRVPEGDDDVAWCEKLIAQANVVCAPGSGFGEFGKGYLRFAMTVPLELIQKAAEKIVVMLNR